MRGVPVPRPFGGLFFEDSLNFGEIGPDSIGVLIQVLHALFDENPFLLEGFAIDDVSDLITRARQVLTCPQRRDTTMR